MTRFDSPARTALAAAGVLALLAAPAALAGPHGPHHFGPHGHGPGPAAGFALGMAVERLELSAGQREEIREILTAHHDAMAATHERLRELRHELAGAGLGGPVDEEAIRAAAAELGELEATLALGRAGALGTLRDVLTPEQLEELRALREERHELRGPWRGERGPRRPRGR